MSKTNINKICANSIHELNANSIGLNHDHCYHLYRGEMKNIPLVYKHLEDKNFEYILIYKED